MDAGNSQDASAAGSSKQQNVQELVSSGGGDAPTASSQPPTSAATSAKNAKKRKPMKLRAPIWAHFTIEESVDEESGIQYRKATCKYCKAEYKANTRECGTSTLNAHLGRCDKYEGKKEST
jgi:hypothetical protein